MIITKRREKCLEEFKKTQLDGLLFASSANFQYLTETKSYMWQRFCFNLDVEVAGARIIPEALVFMDQEGKTTILTTPALKLHFDINKNDVVVSYMDQFEDELKHIVKGKKIGIGRDCDQWLINTLKNVDPEIETYNIETVFDDIRRIKDEEEIDQMTKLAKFTDDAVMYVCKHLKKGMTMFDAERMIVNYGLLNGVQDLSFSPTCGFKTRNTENAQAIEPFEDERILEDGTMIAFDIGYMDQGYCSDWGRTVYCGKAPELVKKGYEALQAGQLNMIKNIVPGKTNINELYGFVHEEVKRRGYEEFLRFKDRGSLGHQIGIECHEFPMLNKSVDFVLQPGMVFCSEPKLWFPNEVYMRVEDMVLVTEDGARSLSQFDRELFEIKAK